jgi:tRNA (guanine-N7-)-methyltransferase
MAVSHGKSWTLSSSSAKSSAKPGDQSSLKRRLWGRRMGRPLKKDRLHAIESVLPVVAIPADKITDARDLDPASLFAKPFKEFWFEIGFGNGEHLIALKNGFPDVGFIGAEPFVNGMANFLKDAEDLGNVRVHMDDAMMIVRSLKDQSLERIYILNPDPWPKTRHHKRRIVSQTNLDEFARVLKPGGRLVLATDVDDLAQWMDEQCTQHPLFEWGNDSPDRHTPPIEWTETRYAFKGKQAGRRQTFLIFNCLERDRDARA